MSVNVARATPTVSVPPENITYGTALSNGQLSGTATATVGGNPVSVPGTFTYTSAAGTVPDAGKGQSEAVTFTPNDSTDYAAVYTTVTVNVAPATPTVSGHPVNLIYGTALSNSQLDGSATWTVGGKSVSVPGAFTYTSVAGTILVRGNGQSEAVTFTPNDTVDYATASTTVSVNIAPATTTTSTVRLSSSTAVYGQPVTLTATVSNTQTSLTPSGAVGFYDGSTELGAAQVGAGGVATLTVSTLSVRKHTITASFSDPVVNFAPDASPSAVALTIGMTSTSTELTATTNTPVFGQGVTFTATVAADAPGNATPTGSVTFMDGGTVLKTVNLSGGSASFTTTNLAVASHSITATYNGSGSFTASPSAASAVRVSRDATTAVVSASASNPVVGQAVTLKATVTAAAPGSGKPTGTVSFYGGTTLLGAATFSDGVASIKTTALAVGVNSITVVYGGGGDFLGTTSPAVTITVKQDSTTTKLTSSSATSKLGTLVTFTAAVLPAPPGSVAPTGTVSFWDGSTLLGTATLSGGVARLTYNFTAIGKLKIKAVYNGDADFLPSTLAVLNETIP